MKRSLLLCSILICYSSFGFEGYSLMWVMLPIGSYLLYLEYVLVPLGDAWV